MSRAKHWLVAYDIGCRHRLRRVHKYMCGVGIPVQYSVFSVVANDRQLRAILDDLDVLIDPATDDVRAYHLPEQSLLWVLGAQGFPEGIRLDAGDAARLFGKCVGSALWEGKISPTHCASD
jgi:CRISPR-associated protein Cas2